MNVAAMESVAGKSTFNVLILEAARVRFLFFTPMPSGSSQLSLKSCYILLGMLDTKDKNSRLGLTPEKNIPACQETQLEWSQHLLQNSSPVCEKHSALGEGVGGRLCLEKELAAFLPNWRSMSFFLINREWAQISQRDHAENRWTTGSWVANCTISLPSVVPSAIFRLPLFFLKVRSLKNIHPDVFLGKLLLIKGGDWGGKSWFEPPPISCRVSHSTAEHLGVAGLYAYQIEGSATFQGRWVDHFPSRDKYVLGGGKTGREAKTNKAKLLNDEHSLVWCGCVTRLSLRFLPGVPAVQSLPAEVFLSGLKSEARSQSGGLSVFWKRIANQAGMH